jgi:hypothetical protein
MHNTVRLGVAAAVLAAVSPFARAIPEPGSPAIKPANGYASVSVNPLNPLDITVTAKDKNFGVFWVAIYSKCKLKPASTSTTWATHPDSKAAVWRTNTGANGKMLVTPDNILGLAFPASGRFVAALNGNCTLDPSKVVTIIHVIDLRTGNTFWTLPGGGPPPNRPPDAVDDCTYDVKGGESVTIPVLNNDSDPDNDPLTIISTTPPAFGAIVVNPDQTITYTAPLGYEGPDEFTYTISDGKGGTDTAKVCLEVAYKPQGDECKGILLFGPDINKIIYQYLQTADPALAAITDNVVTSSGVYQPGSLTAALDAKLARDGVPYCAILVDPEFYGPNGMYSGLSAGDEARLKQELLNGVGFVYPEPGNPDNGTPSGPHPQGQLPNVLPVYPRFWCDHSQQYLVTDLTSPLASGILNNPFNAASSCQNTEVVLLPPVPGVTYSNVNPVAISLGQPYVPGTGGNVIYTLNYGPAQSRVAIIGTDPYPDNIQVQDTATILKIYHNALKWAAGL